MKKWVFAYVEKEAGFSNAAMNPYRSLESKKFNSWEELRVSRITVNSFRSAS